MTLSAEGFAVVKEEGSVESHTRVLSFILHRFSKVNRLLKMHFLFSGRIAMFYNLMA